MSAIANLPEWVWRLLEALDEYEDEHPVLFRETARGDFAKADCPHSAGVLNHIPPEVMAIVEAMRARRYGMTDGER